jgi:hypothetical protein
MVMMIVGTIILVVFILMISELYDDNASDKKRLLAEDFGKSIQQEFLLAQRSKPGYSRDFEMPDTLEGFSYDAFIVNSILVINYSEGQANFKIPSTNGQLVIGENTIRNINDTICLNC